MYKGLVSFIALITFAFTGLTEAQDIGGRIQGIVVSSETGETLPRADVSIKDADMTANTDLDGRYIIDGVPDGIYKIQAHKSGYAISVVTDVEVKQGETTEANIALTPEAIQLGTVEVTAKRARSTVAGLLSSQRKASSIGASISAEQIKKSPDSDASDVLKKVTGLTVG